MSLQYPKRSLLIINVLTGISDGLILPLMICIIAFPFFIEAPWKLLFIGVMASAIGALLYGTARYLGEKEEIHHHHPEFSSDHDEQEMALLQHIGIAPELADNIKTEVIKEKERWLQEIEGNGMGWEIQEPGRAFKSGLHTAAGFFLGGVSVTVAFGLDLYIDHLPLLAAGILGLSLLYLFISGAALGHITGRSLRRTAIAKTLRGLAAYATAALVAFILLQVMQPGI